MKLVAVVGKGPPATPAKLVEVAWMFQPAPVPVMSFASSTSVDETVWFSPVMVGDGRVMEAGAVRVRAPPLQLLVVWVMGEDVLPK